MKQFNNVVILSEYKNKYNQTIKLILDENLEMWFYHPDKNEDFESLTEYIIAKGNGKYPFPYILSYDEQIIVQNFVDTCNEMFNLFKK